jgi:hypothetical protein
MTTGTTTRGDFNSQRDILHHTVGQGTDRTVVSYDPAGRLAAVTEQAQVDGVWESTWADTRTYDGAGQLG